MTTTSTLYRLLDALRAEADASASVVAVASLPAETGDDTRKAAAEAALTSYRAAYDVAEALLDLVIAQGGCPGLVEALHGAENGAYWRMMATYDIPDAAAHQRAYAVARYAYDVAMGRQARAQRDVVEPWAARRAQMCAQAATAATGVDGTAGGVPS